MKLTIVTINYNNAEGLRKTLASVAAQTYRDIEHIIVDGGSSDESIDVIKEYESIIKQRVTIHQSTIQVKWISEPDNGIYNAMNRGIKRATGDYIQILNSGDILVSNDVTARMVAVLNSLNLNSLNITENVPIFYGNMLKDYGNGKIVRDTCGNRMYTPESFLYFYKGTLNHDCAYIRKDLFEKFGLYNEEMKICSDWEWYVRAIVLGNTRAIYTDIDVTIFDMNGISESGGKNAELIKKERREYLEKILPPAILRDYDAFSFPILQYQRLKKYHLWPLVYFLERILFKLEKWGVLK